MANRVVKAGIVVLALALFFLVWPVTAEINTITTGATVFVGEDELDITGAMGGDLRIGWWASGAAPATTSPDYSVQVSNPASFYVSPEEFGSHTGPWYRLDTLGNVNGVAFTVVDPRLVLKVEDTTVGVDVTNKWVPTGDSVRFRIETNLIPISQRPGVTSVPITIKVQSPDGAVYTSLVDSSGTSTSTVDIPVTSTPYYTGSIWDTGRIDLYPAGNYTLWAECNVNFMNDRYDVAGKTISVEVSLLNQVDNPLISTTTPTPAPTTQIPTTQVTISPTTQPTTVPPTVTATPSTPVPTVLTTVPSVTPSPSPTQTETPGFEGILASAAILAVCVLYYRKK
jgi:hypothetical protein